MKRTRIFINNFLYLDLSILEISSIVIYEIGYDYVKPKYGEKAKLRYMDTNNFMAYKKTEYIYSDILKDVETISDTSNYKLDKPLPKGKKVIWSMKDELGGKIIAEFAALRPKTYSY